MDFKKSEILVNEEISPSIYKMVIKEEASIKPGQFYMLKSTKGYLQRPISICEKDGDKLTFLYAVVGEGTKGFATMKAGEEITFIGPLGNGFNLEFSVKKLAIVGGGIGVAPLLQVAKEARKENIAEEINFYAGFRDEIYLDKELEKYVDNLKITTNTGKYGHKGFVTEIFNPQEYDMVLCCGPEVMMKAVVKMCIDANTKVFVSMEKHMACGVGACLVCTCKTKEGNKRTCKDGPVFNGEYVEF